MRLTLTCAAAAAIALAACDTDVQPGDTTPPTLTVLDLANNDAVVFTTDPSNAPSPVVCANGGRPFTLPADQLDQNVYYVMAPGVDTTTLLFNFFDRSGIQSAKLSFPDAVFNVQSPSLPIVTDATNNQSAAEWTFEESGTLRTSAGLTLRIEVPEDNGTSPFFAISYASTDGAGNATDADRVDFFFFNSQVNACH